jgi:hypothetical protein
METWQPVFTAVLTAFLSGGVVLLLQYVILPRLEREKTIQQEEWKSKKDAFLAAMDTADRVLANVPWEDAPADIEPNVEDIPDSNEINSRLHRLLLLSNDINIPLLFNHLISGVSSPEDRKRFLQLLRRELFRSELNLEGIHVPFFLPRSKEQMKSLLDLATGVAPLLSRLGNAGAIITSVQIHKPRLGEVSFKLTVPGEEVRNKCFDLLRGHASPPVNCSFNDSDVIERFPAEGVGAHQNR